MRRAGRGHLVFVSSLAGKAATARASIYNATKFGLRGFAFACARTCAAPASASPSSARVRSATAGMFADSGADAPPRLGTGTPEQVAAAVVSAIERNRARSRWRRSASGDARRLASNAPEISSRLSGGLAAKVADEVAARQTEKR